MVHAPADPAEAAYLPSSLVGTKVKFRVLGPVIEPDAAGKARLRTFGEKPGSAGSDDGKTKNGHSIVLMLEYGALRILLGGDLNSSAEAFLLTHYTGLAWPPANVGAATTLAEAGVHLRCRHRQVVPPRQRRLHRCLPGFDQCSGNGHFKRRRGVARAPA